MKATKFSQYLQPREELQFVDRPHWIYVVEAAFWALFVIIIGFLANMWLGANFITPRIGNTPDDIGRIILYAAAYVALFLKWGALVYGIFHFINRVIFFFCTYVFCSDRRVYEKKGLIRVRVFEVSFDEIRSVDINYGTLGRFLGYGKLQMDARFVQDEDLPFTYCPEKIQKLIHYNNDLSQDINLSMVTKDMRKGAARTAKIPPSTYMENAVDPMSDQMDSIDYAYPTERAEYEDIAEEESRDLEQKTQEDFDDAAETEKDDDISRPARDNTFLK